MRRVLSYLFMALSVACSLPCRRLRRAENIKSYELGCVGGRHFRWPSLPPVAALGQGRATASATEALARNPAARPGITFALILGLALSNHLALYTL